MSTKRLARRDESTSFVGGNAHADEEKQKALAQRSGVEAAVDPAYVLLLEIGDGLRRRRA
jgi:hypothetical protein